MDEDTPIDFGALERELNDKIKAEERYWQENDAKFRAVNQKVASYEEFRDIVKAAHLKPLDKTEKVYSLCNKYSVWNTITGNKKNECRHNKQQNVELGVHVESALPATTGEFLKKWQVLNCSDRFRYLKQFQQNQLHSLFCMEVPMGILGEMFEALLTFDPAASDTTFVVAVLKELSKSRRFALTLQFLSPKERECGRKLLDKLDQSAQVWQHDFTEKAVSELDISSLRQKYQMY